MASRALPVGLLLLTLVVDAEGLHKAGFYVLVFALTAAAVSALSLFGDLVELPGRGPGVALARLEVACGGLGAVLVLVAAAARGQTAATNGVPALAVSATVGGLLLLGPVMLGALVRTGAPLLRRAQLADRRAP
jgi:hypothetical protein